MTANTWQGQIAIEQSEGTNLHVLDWPGEICDLEGWPLLYIRVFTPRDQALLHRHLAKLGYVPDLLGEDGAANYWRFYHPDGARPCHF